MLKKLRELSKNVSLIYAQDDKDIRNSISELLKTCFTQFEVFDNGHAAWTSWLKKRADLVITDLSMPEMDGLELSKLLLKKNPEQRIIIISAHSDSEKLISLINARVSSFVLKPVEFPHLLHIIKKELQIIHALKQEKEYFTRMEKEVELRTQELTKANRALISVQKARENMLKLVSHELRTPINGLLGFIQLLKSNIDDKSKDVYIQHIESSALRLEKSTKKALEIVSVHEDDKVRIQEFPLVEIFPTDMLQSCEFTPPEILERTVFFRIYFCKIVWENLWENAKKYGNAPYYYSLRTEDGDYIMDFRDSGPGFATDILNTPFSTFQTGDVFHHQEGMGLGLSLVSIAVEHNGGKITLQNSSEGGAQILIRFPAEHFIKPSA